MLVVQVLRWLLLAAEMLISIPVLYVCILSITAILITKKRKAENTNPASALGFPQPHFAIIVPAHNEEVLLGHLLESLSALAYPKERYTVYVVADNCTDTTAELACTYDGVQVYERFDEVKRSKGYALEWIFQKLEEKQLLYDAYVIIDADSVLEPAFLQFMARDLAGGAQALQAHYTVLNMTESPSASLRWIAFALQAHVRPLSRSALGGSSTLTGNGMCFSRALIERCPWRAYSLSEDYQYYLTLVKHGERVRYVPEAVVYSHMPTTFKGMRTQDIRWESAGSGLTVWQSTRELLKAGLHLHNFACFEAVMELLAPPLSFMVSWCVLTLIASLMLWSPIALVLSLLLIGGLIFYVSTAFYLLHPPLVVYKALLYAPGFVLWKLWVLLVLSRSKKHTSEWIRTSRPSS
jgi:cellulose synthase/poly-beta-1,6-N-acetylglucosamine synthase-like glycosyltransferase